MGSFPEEREKKGYVFLLKTGQETKLASKVLHQAVFRREFHGMSRPVPDAPEQHCLPGTTGSPGPEQQHLLRMCPVQNQSSPAPHWQAPAHSQGKGIMMLPWESPPASGNLWLITSQSKVVSLYLSP